MPIKRCPRCHGKGKYTFIRRITFGDDPQIETEEHHCRDCDGEGKIYFSAASKAPVEAEDARKVK